MTILMMEPVMEKLNSGEISLVRRAKKGEREAFGQLMENHALQAYRIAFAILQNKSDAEDVVQEAFVTVYNSIGKLKKESSFNSWLSRIVTTRAYDFLRKKQHNCKAEQGKTYEIEEKRFHNSRESDEDFSLDLHEAIGRLPELHRLAILLRYSGDASTEDIAQVLDRPAGTVRRMLSESYRLLRLYLQGDSDS